jgi:hypothetical protein
MNIRVRSCPECEYLGEPNAMHKWHSCLWIDRTPIPNCVRAKSNVVSIENPECYCPAWKERAAGDKR